MPLHNLNILQWNCRSLTSRLPDLIHLLDEFKINISILCETKLDNNIYLSFLFTVNRNRFSGGIAIMVKRDLRFTHINDDRIKYICDNNDIEIILDKIWIERNSHIFICSIYSPPRFDGNHLPTNHRTWKEIFSYLSNFDPIIIESDINGKSTLWSNDIQRPDAEGLKLESAIANNNLICLNNGNPTWTSSDLSSTSSLDITMSTPSIAHSCNWRILDYTYGSDHHYNKYQ